MKKEEIDIIMYIMFDDLVNYIQSELQTQTIPLDDKKLCSLDHKKPKISPLAKAEGLYWRVNNIPYLKSVNHTGAAVLVSSCICKSWYYM